VCEFTSPPSPDPTRRAPLNVLYIIPTLSLQSYIIGSAEESPSRPLRTVSSTNFNFKEINSFFKEILTLNRSKELRKSKEFLKNLRKSF
jgi:hypothetical protein